MRIILILLKKKVNRFLWKILAIAQIGWTSVTDAFDIWLSIVSSFVYFSTASQTVYAAIAQWNTCRLYSLSLTYFSLYFQSIWAVNSVTKKRWFLQLLKFYPCSDEVCCWVLSCLIFSSWILITNDDCWRVYGKGTPAEGHLIWKRFIQRIKRKFDAWNVHQKIGL